MIRNVLLCSLISLFFPRSPPLAPPPLHKTPPPMTHGSRAELTDTSSLIIRLLERPDTPRPPPSPWPSDPVDAEEQIILQECALGQVEGSTGVKKAPWRHLRPLCCLRFLRDWRLPKVRQQLWIQHRVWFGRRACFHRKNIFIDKTFVFCPKLFCWIFFFWLGCQTVARKTSPASCLWKQLLEYLHMKEADIASFTVGMLTFYVLWIFLPHFIRRVLINPWGSRKGYQQLRAQQVLFLTHKNKTGKQGVEGKRPA